MLKRIVVMALVLGLLAASCSYAAPTPKSEFKDWVSQVLGFPPPTTEAPILPGLDIPPPIIPEPFYTLASRLQSNPSNPALKWASKVLSDASSPTWKRQCAERLVFGKCTKLTGMRMTHYQPSYPFNKPHYDKLGGNGSPAWGCRKYARRGDVAASKRWPFGTVFYSPREGRALIVADRGPAVKKATHLDVCLIHTTRSEVYTTHNGETVWVIGRVSKKIAR